MSGSLSWPVASTNSDLISSSISLLRCKTSVVENKSILTLETVHTYLVSVLVPRLLFYQSFWPSLPQLCTRPATPFFSRWVIAHFSTVSLSRGLPLEWSPAQSPLADLSRRHTSVDVSLAFYCTRPPPFPTQTFSRALADAPPLFLNNARPTPPTCWIGKNAAGLFAPELTKELLLPFWILRNLWVRDPYIHLASSLPAHPFVLPTHAREKL